MTPNDIDGDIKEGTESEKMITERIISRKKAGTYTKSVRRVLRFLEFYIEVTQQEKEFMILRTSEILNRIAGEYEQMAEFGDPSRPILKLASAARIVELLEMMNLPPMLTRRLLRLVQ